ncbi:hypothetical protein CRP403_gp52 [Roseobacter phage CRP-403]|uniref:Uncharacterized protein n=1 Tax=Roseobacter phage CRP-403 TaxID=3072849 RepID=A0AAX3ZX51_9CAUD|nr:hypothetical protein CRP403_gp52 [Roseobacter phage CRP-403]
MSNNGIIYRGPSLIDGKPIVVVATYSNRNRKTGTMVQTYILVDGMKPTDASKCGADFSICGNCPHRGIATDDPTKKQAVKRSCYVVLGQGPTIIHKSVERGVYPTVQGHEAIAAIGRGRMVRLGTYGDPAAVPSYIWESLISEAVGHTAYSHQSECATADTRPDMYMTSADNADQAQAAWSRGERTFRVVSSRDDLVKGKEILCPASKEAGQRVSCVDCKLCVGSSIAAKSIAIVAHGAGASHFAA